MSLAEESMGQQPEIAIFVAKTYQILNHTQFIKIVFWSHEGNEFIIKDSAKFQQVVLPKYFRHRKMNSFVRQLNMYGFHKSKKDNYRNSFSHPYFLRGRDLLRYIKRRSKTTNEDIISLSESFLDKQKCTNGNMKQLLQIESQKWIGSTILKYDDILMITSEISIGKEVKKEDDLVSLQDKIEKTSKIIQFQNPSYFFGSFSQN